LQLYGKEAIEDVQNFINVIWDCTSFFYRRCISLDNQAFGESVIEMATAMLFEANGGEIFNMMRGLFVA